MNLKLVRSDEDARLGGVTQEQQKMYDRAHQFYGDSGSHRPRPGQRNRQSASPLSWWFEGRLEKAASAPKLALCHS